MSGSGLLLPQNDPRVHENLVNIMDRRLSNVQLMRSSRSNSAHSQVSFSVPSLADNTSRQSSWTAQSINVNPPFFYNQPSNVNSDSVNNNNATNNMNSSYYYYQSQAGFNKRRRTTLWETITGLVCSLGALATRAAKMAARRAEPL